MLQQRILEYKDAVMESFTKRYGLTRLIHVEWYDYVNDALQREKQLKWWQRQWKIEHPGSRVLARDDKNSVKNSYVKQVSEEF